MTTVWSLRGTYRTPATTKLLRSGTRCTRQAVPVAANGEEAAPALFGCYEIDGRACKTVFQLLLELTAKYSPEECEKITWVPAPKGPASSATVCESQSGLGNRHDARR